MIVINLEMAREILEKQGFEIQVSLKEALLERYSIIEDIKLYVSEIVQEGKITTEQAQKIMDVIHKNKVDIESDFENYFDDNDTISDIYWEIIRIILNKYVSDDFSAKKVIL